MPQAFGWIDVDGCRSKTIFEMPLNDSNIEQVRPMGPPPMMTTEATFRDPLLVMTAVLVVECE
jgi:hypothetical protein